MNTSSDALAPGTGLLSLREAVAFANASPAGNSSISFDAAVFATPQMITLTGTQLELSNTGGVQSITGPAAGVTVSGGGLSRVFQVDPNVTASISGLTITGGNVDHREWRRTVQPWGHDHADRGHDPRKRCQIRRRPV